MSHQLILVVIGSEEQRTNITLPVIFKVTYKTLSL